MSKAWQMNPALTNVLSKIRTDQTQIEIESTQDQINVSIKALRLLADVLKAMSEGKSISIVPFSAEISTRKAADIPGCSRPYFIKLLERGEIEFVKTGKHRRVRIEQI